MDDSSFLDALYLALGTGVVDEEEFSLFLPSLDSDEEEDIASHLGLDF